MNVLNTLQDFAKKLMRSSNVSFVPEKGKRCLETRYRARCMDETSKFHHIALVLLYPTQRKMHSSVLKVKKLALRFVKKGIGAKYTKHSQHS